MRMVPRTIEIFPWITTNPPLPASCSSLGPSLSKSPNKKEKRKSYVNQQGYILKTLAQDSYLDLLSVSLM